LETELGSNGLERIKLPFMKLLALTVTLAVLAMASTVQAGENCSDKSKAQAACAASAKDSKALAKNEKSACCAAEKSASASACNNGKAQKANATAKAQGSAKGGAVLLVQR
jgi:hypothetical protein